MNTDLISSRKASIQLLLCGAAALFWELLLIRWLGSCVRVISYYTNFILISSFFGLGAGALLVRFRFRAWKFILPMLALCILVGPLLGGISHHNPASSGEFVWIGNPHGVPSSRFEAWLLPDTELPYWSVLIVVFAVNTAVFVMFGQWLGTLFKRFSPLRGYSIEIGGSIIGILLFALVSLLNLPPTVWFLFGFLLVLLCMHGTGDIRRSHLVVCAAVCIALAPFVAQSSWSRYYKIQTLPFDIVWDIHRDVPIEFGRDVGVRVTVNNDYHQMALDLRPRPDEHRFLQSWRNIYDYPYTMRNGAPEGPVLIVGAGTGNDVSAALRAGKAPIDAVEIDPALIDLGRRIHVEQPYSHPDVTVFVDDARSFFAKTDRRYAMVVFGFVDSHTLMSSFSSLRLDNFVYTHEAMQRVRELLLPGGKVVLTFAANHEWLHKRMIGLLDGAFDQETVTASDAESGYANGIVYINERSSDSGRRPPSAAGGRNRDGLVVPTDDWPFLYMKDRSIPSHYRLFMVVLIATGAASLLLLPPGARRIEFPYFFMGAGFFLIETSNVVSLSLLYGSTWAVNVLVFTGILGLILAGNLTCMAMTRPRFRLLFPLLLASVLLAYLTPSAALLGIESRFLQGALAVPVFLGPIYLASLIFGHLIKREENFYRAYGSNLLGAVVGGSCEYLSIAMGLKFLLLITMAFYLLAFVFHETGRRRIPQP